MFGFLEVLLEFLKFDAVKIFVVGIVIGLVNKWDVMGVSVMYECKKFEYVIILVFDVLVMKEVYVMGEEFNVCIFIVDIIYYLFD